MAAGAPFHALTVAVPAARCHRVATGAGGLQALGRRPVLPPQAAVTPLVRWFTEMPKVEPGAPRDLVLAGLTTALLGLALHGAALPDEPEHGGLTAGQLRDTLAYADERTTTGLSVAGWSAAVGLAPGVFTRRFAVEFGMAPYAWFLQRRVEHAATMLEKGTASVGDIAAVAGFSSQSHFTDAFTQRFGLPPGQWRRSRR